MGKGLETKHILLVIASILLILFIANRLVNTKEKNVSRQYPLRRMNPDFILYYFYNDKCGFCTKFQPAWEEVTRRLYLHSNISLRKIDINDPANENLTFYYNVTGSPTIIMVSPTQNIQYVGDRSPNDLTDFVLKHMRDS